MFFVLIRMRALLLMLLVVAVYQPAVNAGFIWNDDYFVTDNKLLQTTEGLKRIWFDFGATEQYYPMTFTSFWIEYHLWQLNPYGYHLVNILLHALNTVLLWFLLRRLSIPGAWLAAAIFGLHPVHVESVAWIAERKNVLSGFFYLASIITYLRFYNIGGNVEGGGSHLHPKNFYILSFFLFLLAVLSKTVTGSLPVIIILLLWWKNGHIKRRDIWFLLPYFGVVMVAGPMTIWMERYLVGPQGAQWSFALLERCLIAGRAIWFYAGKFFLPVNLMFTYPQWEIDTTIWWQYFFPLGWMTALVVLWLLQKRIERGPFVAVMFFTVTLFPALGFFDFYPMLFTFVADHFQYLASIGLITLSVSVFMNILPNRTKLLLGGVLLAILGMLTWRQGYIYKNSETIWRDTLAKDPRSWWANSNLGSLLSDGGRYEEAIYYFSKALEIHPRYPLGYYLIGLALTEQGKLEEAIPYFEKALQLFPGYAEAHYDFGDTLIRAGQHEKAIAHYTEALRIQPNNAEIHHRFAKALAELGNAGQAVVHYHKAIQLDPSYADSYIHKK